MATLHLFANDTAPTGPELDSNFAIYGTLTPIPCVVSGTDTLALTVNASGVTVPQYNQYQQYTGVAAASNNGPVNASVGSLAQLPVYKDSPSGPTALTGNEIIQNCAVNIMYDSALNSGGGGFHLINQPAISGTAQSFSSITIGGGQTITRVQSTLASLTFSSMNPQTTQDQSILLAGVKVEDNILIGPPPGITTGIIYSGFVSGAGTIDIRAFNISNLTITPTGGNYRVTDIGFT